MQVHKSCNILTIVRPFQSFVDQKLLIMKQVLSVYIPHDYVPCFQVIRQELLFNKATVDITQINGFYALVFDVTYLSIELTPFLIIVISIARISASLFRHNN